MAGPRAGADKLRLGGQRLTQGDSVAGDDRLRRAGEGRFLGGQESRRRRPHSSPLRRHRYLDQSRATDMCRIAATDETEADAAVDYDQPTPRPFRLRARSPRQRCLPNAKSTACCRRNPLIERSASSTVCFFVAQPGALGPRRSCPSISIVVRIGDRAHRVYALPDIRHISALSTTKPLRCRPVRGTAPPGPACRPARGQAPRCTAGAGHQRFGERGPGSAAHHFVLHCAPGRQAVDLRKKRVPVEVVPVGIGSALPPPVLDRL